MAYVRVSTAEQSVANQLPQVQAYCTAQGWPLADIVTDEGVSTQKHRPGLCELLRRARAGQLERVVVVRLDRLGRSVRELLATCDALEANGVAVVSIKENLDTGTPTGRFLRTVLAAVAELEREMISDRTRAGLEEAWKAGKQKGRPALIAPDVASSIRAWHAQGAGASDICRRLSAANVAPPNGMRWYPSTVTRLLKRSALAS